MGWLKLVQGVVSLFGALAGIFKDRQLISAGEDKANAAASAEAFKRVEEGRAVSLDGVDPDERERLRNFRD
jgi:hypothetical protein